LIVLSCGHSSALAGTEAPKLVVVIYPYECDGAPGIIEVNRALRSTFSSQMPGHIEVRNEYVDTSRLRDAEFMRAQVALLQRKYAGRKIDLVIAGLSSGLDFALAIRNEVFPEIPIVHVLVDQREVQARRLPPDVNGVPVRMDLTGTLDLALRLHADTRRVFVIAGSSPLDTEWVAEMRRAFRPYENRLEFSYLTGLAMEELLERVAVLPEQSVVYYLHAFKDSNGTGFAPAEVLERLAVMANAPIYSHVDTFIDRGALGGHVYSHEAEGKVAARLGLRILAGEKPQSIPVSELSENTYLFNWRQLRRWGIKEESLPHGSVIHHRELTFWNTYRWHVIGAVSLCLVESLLVGGLLVQWVKRWRADERFRQVVEMAPTGMLIVGRDGLIIMANAQVEQLFGYAKDELVGRPVELLLPEQSRGKHATNRDRFFAAPGAQASGPGRDLSGRRKDESEFPVEVGLSPLRTPRELFVLVSIIDLTERRQAEAGLRASQRELKSLTGRLIETQELERRRVARELHDDLNQGLALLSVEIDLLGQKQPASAAELTERMRELSGRVRDLSSSVHDLSHQLHPSKLEQLGLVAALCGLCKEMGHGHNLDVKFTHSPELGKISQDVALCLYRIAQEALRNVVKHSASRCAAVELWEAANVIRLRVTDAGIGFHAGAVGGNGGLGLASMRERLHLVGGEITIDSRPSGGTRIDVRVPAPIPVRSQNALRAESLTG